MPAPGFGQPISDRIEAPTAMAMTAKEEVLAT